MQKSLSYTVFWTNGGQNDNNMTWLCDKLKLHCTSE